MIPVGVEVGKNTKTAMDDKKTYDVSISVESAAPDENGAFEIPELPPIEALLEEGLAPEGYEAVPLPYESVLPLGQQSVQPLEQESVPPPRDLDFGNQPEHFDPPADFEPQEADQIEENTISTGLSLEELLDHELAVSENKQPAPGENLAVHPDQLNSFQLKVCLANEQERIVLEKTLQDLEMDSMLEGQKTLYPMITRLNELQATLLYQLLNRVGIAVDCTQLQFASLQSNALDESTDIQWEATAASESSGAPAVTLLENAREVLLLTPNELPGYLISETQGIISAHRTIAKRLFREQDAQRKLVREISAYQTKSSGNKAVMSNHIDKTFAEIFFDLQKNALAVGANAVLDIRLEIFSEYLPMDTDREQVRLIAVGSATTVEKLQV